MLCVDADQIIANLKRLGVTHERIAAAINRDRTAATRLLSGQRSMKVGEMAPLKMLILDAQAEQRDLAADNVRPLRPLADRMVDETKLIDYETVEVLPTFAGMGGGGTGDGDGRTALLPRHLIADELRAKPSDLLLIDVRGDSMMPDFKHGDQILIDRRDRNPIQPGPFAIWDGDGYVVKNIERVPGRKGHYRVFSSNGRYTDQEYAEDSISIMGRPVWFARKM